MNYSKYLSKIHRIPKFLYRIIERKINQLHAFDYPDTSEGWEKYGSKPVYGNYATGSIFDPFVFYHNNIYLMYVSERNSASIIRLESKDGIKWKNKVICINGSHKNQWDSIINRASVLLNNGIWHMWFTGQYKDESCIGYAISTDGIFFHKVIESPILTANTEYEGKSVMNPCVIWDETDKIYKMWYSAGEQYEPDVICYAESKDGISWQRYKNNPIINPNKNNKYEQYKIGGCQVIKNKNQYEMFYIGYQNVDVARICQAHSTDGIHWKRESQNPILSPTRNSWDSDAIYKPTFICQQDGSIFLWYNGRKKKNEYIGFAKKR